MYQTPLTVTYDVTLLYQSENYIVCKFCIAHIVCGRFHLQCFKIFTFDEDREHTMYYLAKFPDFLQIMVFGLALEFLLIETYRDRRYLKFQIKNTSNKSCRNILFSTKLLMLIIIVSFHSLEISIYKERYAEHRC